MYFNIIAINHSDNSESRFLTRPYLYDFFYVVALFCMANLGFYQVQNMVELTIRLNEPNAGPKLERKILQLNLVIKIVVIFGYMAMIFLAIMFMIVL